MRGKPQAYGLVWASLASIAVAMAGCEGAPPSTVRGPQTRPAVEGPPPTSRPGGEATSKPATAEAVAPGVAPGVTPEKPAPPKEPELPEYVTLVERFNTREPVTLKVQTEGRSRLVVETRNVRRLRIERDRVPLERRRSIALVLDGQGIEWVSKSDVVEFERSLTGNWEPVKPGRR